VLEPTLGKHRALRWRLHPGRLLGPPCDALNSALGDMLIRDALGRKLIYGTELHWERQAPSVVSLNRTSPEMS
jgi:hypothetical protein